MMVPFQLTLIQMYIQLAKLNLHNTIWAITLPFLSQTMFLFMSRQFFYSVPNELIEAARLDGLTHAGVFFALCCPISKSLFDIDCNSEFHRNLELLYGAGYIYQPCR